MYWKCDNIMNKNGRIDILLIIGTLIMLALSIGILELNHIIELQKDG